MSRYSESICCPKVVLLVDDSDDDRLLFRESCEGLNLELLEAARGRDGLELMEQREDISLMLVDSMMPTMCGMDVYREIRQRGDHRRIVFWTGHAGELADRLREFGCAMVIPKPHKINRSYVRDMLGHFGVREIMGEAVPA